MFRAYRRFVSLNSRLESKKERTGKSSAYLTKFHTVHGFLQINDTQRQRVLQNAFAKGPLVTVQGYLAQEKTHPPRTLQYMPRALR